MSSSIDDSYRYKDSTLKQQSFSSFRRWKIVNHRKPMRGDIDFKLVSWNILSQDLIDLHYDLYERCSKRSLNWSYRCSKILKYLFDSNKNYKLICLQELTDYHYENDFKPKTLNCGYKSIYLNRGGSKRDGCAIIYHTDTFELDSYKNINLGDPNYILDSKRRDNVGIITIFKPKINDSQSAIMKSNIHSNCCKFIVATTHLFFNPKRGDIKVSQLRYFLSEIWKASIITLPNGQVEQLPVILCGDFNFVPNSPLYKYIVNGFIRPIGLKAGDLSGQLNGRGSGPKISRDDLNTPPPPPPTSSSSTSGSESSLIINDVKFESNCAIKNSNSSSLNDDDDDDQQQQHNDSNFEHLKSIQLSHQFNFSSVIPHSFSSEPLASIFVQEEISLVDHIFYTQNTNHKMSAKLNLISYYDLPTESQMRQFGSLPNLYIPSDHLPMEAHFILHPFDNNC